MFAAAPRLQVSARSTSLPWSSLSFLPPPYQPAAEKHSSAGRQEGADADLGRDRRREKLLIDNKESNEEDTEDTRNKASNSIIQKVKGRNKN